MKYIKAVICLGLFYILSVTKIMAWEILPRKIIPPTATPTPIPVKFELKPVEMEIIPLSTVTPTPMQVVVTQVVTATPKPTIEISPTIAQNPTTKPSITPGVTEEVTKKATEEAENTRDLSKWFWQISTALLVLIIITQIWLKKKK